MPAAVPKKTMGNVITTVIERTNSNIRRLRILEQESAVVKNRLTSIEQDLLAARNKESATSQELGKRIDALEEHIAAMESTIKDVIAQLKRTTSTTKIKELEALIDMYNPLKSQFMTREEVEQLLRERLEK